MYYSFQSFEAAGVVLMADGNLDATTRIATLLDYLAEKKMSLEDMAEYKRTKLEQCVQVQAFWNRSSAGENWKNMASNLQRI